MTFISDSLSAPLHSLVDTLKMKYIGVASKVGVTFRHIYLRSYDLSLFTCLKSTCFT